ncbi:MAG TPA: hypothetical protein VM901_09150, partial [Bdellovibrionota bacterium]|nr:hypothetical protein [Bdellovibrionota bacterium]
LKSLDLPGDSAVDIVRRLKICCLSVRELSDIMGTSNSIVYKWLSGESTMPEAYAFPLNQILSDLFTLSAHDFLKKHPTHGNLSQRRDQIRAKTSELAELDRKSAKARPLLETYNMDKARDFLDVLSFHEFQTPAPPQSIASSSEIYRVDFMREWTNLSRLPENPERLEHMDKLLLAEFGSLDEDTQKTLTDAYHARRSRVKNYQKTRSLRANLEIEAHRRESEWQAKHGYPLTPLEVASTFQRVGLGRLITDRYGLHEYRLYSMIDKKSPYMTALMRLDLMEFAERWPKITTAEIQSLLGASEKDAAALLKGFEALATKDAQRMKEYRHIYRLPTANVKQIIDREFDPEKPGFLKRLETYNESKP